MARSPKVLVFIRRDGEEWGAPVWVALYDSPEAIEAVKYALAKVCDGSDADEARICLTNFREKTSFPYRHLEWGDTQAERASAASLDAIEGTANRVKKGDTK